MNSIDAVVWKVDAFTLQTSMSEMQSLLLLFILSSVVSTSQAGLQMQCVENTQWRLPDTCYGYLSTAWDAARHLFYSFTIHRRGRMF